MLVRLCDLCGNPIGDSSNRFAVVSGKLRVEMITQYDGKWSTGMFCFGCILQVVFNGEQVDPSWFARREMVK